MVGQSPGCLSKSLSLSGSKSNCLYGSALKGYFSYPAYPCTFLGGKKSTKRTGPCSLAFGFPRANAFFGAGRNSPASRCSNSLPAFSRKKHLRSATLQWARPAIDAPTWCTKRFASPEAPWCSVLFPEFVNPNGDRSLINFSITNPWTLDPLNP